ncbi:hypothetical protein WMF30_37040 [Sorangium sp. So ce134]
MTTMTTPGTVLGIPGYMAPEQARGVPHVGAAADVFALGEERFQRKNAKSAEMQKASRLFFFAPSR